MIACTHPGKMGDTLYSLPTVKELCKRHKTKADFITSSYCEPLGSLIEYQPYINKFIVSEDYVIERTDIGVQPWLMPVHGEYEAVYHLGFRGVPDTRIDHYIAKSIGLDRIPPIKYEYPYPKYLPVDDYYILAPRGETSYKQTFLDFMKCSNLLVLQVGGDDFIGGENTLNFTNLSFLETASLIAYSKGFVGLMSSQLVLANGFNIPRIAPHDGRSWDMRHVVYEYYNYYPVNPTGEQILSLLKG